MRSASRLRKLERHAAEDERQQHDEDREVKPAGMMMANANWESRKQTPRPPSTSQVSLPSQTGATEFMIVFARGAVRRETAKDADRPRSKPSSSTYRKTAEPPE